MPSSSHSSPPPQPPTDKDSTSSPESEGDTTVQDKKADFWPILFQCMDEPKVNYQKLAKEMGYKNVKVARVCYYKKLKKLGVERAGLKPNKSNIPAKTIKVSKPRPPKNSTPRKPRRGKAETKKGEGQEAGQEKMTEEA